jgi:hypothetical protein
MPWKGLKFEISIGISVVDEKCKENLCKNGLVSILMWLGF